MNDNWDYFVLYIVMLFAAFIIFACGAAYSLPNELENGCIVHNDKIYCEEVREIGEN